MKDEDEKILKRWFAQDRYSIGTQKRHRRVMRDFCKISSRSISELRDEAWEEEDLNVPRRRRKYKDYFIDYISFLDTQDNLAESTKRTYLIVVKSFYSFLDVMLPSFQNKYDKHPVEANVNRSLPKKLIQKMVQNASVRDKAILSFMAMTGQAQNEVKSLTIKKYIDSLNTEFKQPVFTLEELFKEKDQIYEHDCYEVSMYRSKSRTHYWTYMPRETAVLILNYLYERESCRNTNIRVNSLDESLFVTKYGNGMSADSIGKVCVVVGNKCGFDDPSNLEPKLRLLLERDAGNHRTWKSHNLRKYFLNTCRRYGGMNDKIDSNLTGTEIGDFMIGHKQQGSVSHYIIQDEIDHDIMKQHYLQILPYLSLETEFKTFNSVEREEFERNKKKLKMVTDELDAIKDYIKYKERVDRWKTE